MMILPFKDYYLQKHDLKDWGVPGELMSDVYRRFFDTLTEYNKEIMENFKKEALDKEVWYF